MKRIDGYIEEYNVSGNKDYNMYLEYNNIDVPFLYKNREARNFAIYYSHKVHANIPGSVFTDDHSWAMPENQVNTLIAGVFGIRNIIDSIGGLICGCTNLDIQSILDIHLNGEVYNLVGINEETHILGTNYDEWVKLIYALKEIMESKTVLR